jgi:hypothetical protein
MHHFDVEAEAPPFEKRTSLQEVLWSTFKRRVTHLKVLVDVGRHLKASCNKHAMKSPPATHLWLDG